MDLNNEPRINYFLGLFSNGFPLNESLCIEKITNSLTKNTPATYPSSLGEDCDTVTKQQLVIYLVSNIY